MSSWMSFISKCKRCGERATVPKKAFMTNYICYVYRNVHLQWFFFSFYCIFASWFCCSCSLPLQSGWERKRVEWIRLCGRMEERKKNYHSIALIAMCCAYCGKFTAQVISFIWRINKENERATKNVCIEKRKTDSSLVLTTQTHAKIKKFM